MKTLKESLLSVQPDEILDQPLWDVILSIFPGIKKSDKKDIIINWGQPGEMIISTKDSYSVFLGFRTNISKLKELDIHKLIFLGFNGVLLSQKEAWDGIDVFSDSRLSLEAPCISNCALELKSPTRSRDAKISLTNSMDGTRQLNLHHVQIKSPSIEFRYCFINIQECSFNCPLIGIFGDKERFYNQLGPYIENPITFDPGKEFLKVNWGPVVQRIKVDIYKTYRWEYTRKKPTPSSLKNKISYSLKSGWWMIINK